MELSRFTMAIIIIIGVVLLVFWEVIHRKNSTGFIIQKLTNDLDNGDIFFKGWVQTKFFYLLNQIELYRKK